MPPLPLIGKPIQRNSNGTYRHQMPAELVEFTLMDSFLSAQYRKSVQDCHPIRVEQAWKSGQNSKKYKNTDSSTPMVIGVVINSIFMVRVHFCFMQR